MINKIEYIDFAPNLLEKNFWQATTYEQMDAVLDRANQWISKNYNHEIINVETVVLPNIFSKGKASTDHIAQYYTGGQMVQNFQIIRIWFKA